MALQQVASTGQLTLAQVSGVQAGATITDVQFGNPNTGLFQSAPPALQTGQSTMVSAVGYNTSTSSQSLLMVFVVTKPDGTQSTLNGSTGVQSVAAGGLLPDNSPSVLLDQAGTWNVEVQLLSGTTQIATTGQLVMATVTAAPAPAPTMGDQITSLMSMVMMMAMFSMISSMTGGLGGEGEEETEGGVVEEAEAGAEGKEATEVDDETEGYVET